MIKSEVTYTVKGYVPCFKDVVETKTGSVDEIRDELNKVCGETFHSKRAVVRDIILIKQK